MSLPSELVVGGARPLRGRLRVPGDKSISHRAYLIGAVASGRSRCTNLATGDDVHASRLAIEHLGVRVRTGRDGAVAIHGVGFDGLREPEVVLDCGNSGTTIRLLLGLLAPQSFHAVLTGDASLRARPMARVVEPLRAMGAAIDGRDGGAFAPLAVRGGASRGIRHELPVATAQVKSALLLAGAQTDGTTEVLEPARSRDHTERLLGALGAPIGVDGLTVRIRRTELGAFELDVPSDPSSAAFFAVAACITPGSDLVLEKLCCNPTRLGFVDVLRRMGADLEVVPTGDEGGEPVGDLHVRASALRATTISGDEIPRVIDEIPALAIAAAFADGTTEIRDAAELRVKESDRIGTIHQELSQLGIGVEPATDGLVIRGGRPRAALLKSHGDHRIAMAAAIAGHAIDGESIVRGWRAVGSSYPEFAAHLERLAGPS
ncbi:MAG TPA: 3-phosphoshikimate 1-carboxyvinyltransferase [Acidimicrobiia bacterium]|nr:3-phosphoshikimate 1-carboxyvinyltransferase [Acidimicrobiia bacterium]